MGRSPARGSPIAGAVQKCGLLSLSRVYLLVCGGPSTGDSPVGMAMAMGMSGFWMSNDALSSGGEHGESVCNRTAI